MAHTNYFVSIYVELKKIHAFSVEVDIPKLGEKLDLLTNILAHLITITLYWSRRLACATCGGGGEHS